MITIDKKEELLRHSSSYHYTLSVIKSKIRQKNMDLNTFWTQPAKGFSETKRGRTEEEIQTVEKDIGFRFPHSYRELMKLQNGGYTNRTSFFIDGIQRDMSFPMDEMPNTYFKNMREWLEEGESEEEIQAHSKTGHCYPERLVIISGMHGHEFMCLDYGWDRKEPNATPELCYIYQDFKEYLRLPSFDAFLEKLVYFGSRCEEYKFGITTQLPIGELMVKLSNYLGTTFKEHTDTRSGWYNFEKWYSVKAKIDDELSLSICLTPNKFLSGTYIIQWQPDTNYILSIIPMIGTKYVYSNSSKYLRIIKSLFKSFELSEVMKELLIPEEVEG